MVLFDLSGVGEEGPGADRDNLDDALEQIKRVVKVDVVAAVFDHPASVGYRAAVTAEQTARVSHR